MRRRNRYRVVSTLLLLGCLTASRSAADIAALITLTESRATLPSPAEQRLELAVAGRTSTLLHLDVACVGHTIPRTFSRNLIGNTSGFNWYVTRHFAIKSDMPAAQVSESLALLEMALPHLETLFGASHHALAGRRMAFVFAADRDALIRAMISDDMHILRLGGITQEGFWGAYQYAGSPYQNRYIILHELVHLYQYCLAGNTRQFYGFFIEGIADLFSSHVYDPEQQRLTINVLDRAPMHNHLMAGLTEWERQGRPALSQLYASGDTTRGLDVLITAFLQSTPAYEQRWRIYCHELLYSSPLEQPKAASDRLLTSLYGPWPPLDAAFAHWLEQRRPTFVQRHYGFDQQGDWLVSQAAPQGGESLMDIYPAWSSSAAPDPFVRDYPCSGISPAPPPGTLAFELHAPGKQDAPGIIGLRHTGAAFTAAIEHGEQFLISLATNSASLPLSDKAIVAHFTVTTNRLHLELATQPAQQATLPLAPEQYQALTSATPLTLFATAPGLALKPLLWPAPAAAPAPPQRTAPAASRFDPLPALGPLYRAAHTLGPAAPTPLLLARNLLLADAAASTNRLPASEFERSAFWHELGREVRRAKAPPAVRNAALADLSDVNLELVLHPHGATAHLEPPIAGELKGTLAWSLNGRHHSTTRFNSRSDKSQTITWSEPMHGPLHITLRADLQWLELPLTLTADRTLNPSISNWEVLGPFPLPDARLSSTPLPPEVTEPPFGAPYFTAADGTLITWQPLAPPTDTQLETDHLIHFARLFRRQANFSAAYARTSFNVPAACEARLALGLSDGVQVWHNGQPVASDLSLREWAPGNLIVPLSLTAGRNSLIIKSLHSDGLWFLSGRLQTVAGTPLLTVAP